MLDINLNRPAKEILIDLIYRTNQYSLNIHHVDFGKPMALDQRPQDLGDENSFVPTTVDNRTDFRFDGRNGFLYRRLTFQEGGVTGGVHLNTIPPFRTHELIDGINAAYQLQLTPDDVVDEWHYTHVPSITLKAAPESLIWIGESELEIYGDFVQVVLLDGFKEWQP